MTIFSIISMVCRILGFTDWAAKWYALHEQRIRIQRIADTPKTDDEWTKKAEDGEL